MNKEITYAVRNNNFGYVAIVMIPKEEKKKLRIPIGPFPTRKQAEDELELIKNQTDIETFAQNEHEKYKSNPIPRESFKTKVVVFRGKHGDSTYIAKTIEDFRKICLVEFKSNDQMGYYSHLGVAKEPVAPDYLNSIDQVPDDFKEAANEKVRQYRQDLKWFTESSELAKLRDAARNGDGLSASMLIDSMRSGEYEGYEIIEPTEY